MLTVVRVRATIPTIASTNSFVPLTLNNKSWPKTKYFHPKTSLPKPQFLRCFTSIDSKTMNIDATATTTTTESTTENSSEEDVVVQYVVLRRDLIDTWPLGSVVTQGCHASVAAIWLHKYDPSTLSYCSPSSLDSMHKVTLEVKGEMQIVNLSEKLKSNGILHKLWIEQPENIPTCIATKPYPKSMVSPFFKKLKLCK